MLELVLPFKPVPCERARSDRGIVHDTPRNRAVKAHIARLWTITFPRASPIPAGRPVMLTLDFRFERPAKHWVAGRKGDELRADAPRWHTNKPDADNLEKLVKDGLNKIAWADDAQVAVVRKQKTWTAGESCTILTVREL